MTLPTPSPDPTGTNPVTTPAVTPVAPVTAPGQQEPEDYEARFKGLQKVYDKAHRELDNLKTEHATTLEGQEALLQAQRTAQAELERTKTALTALQAEKESLATQLSTQQAQAKRSQLILSEFADLAAFEASGLLSDASTEEEMRDKFTKFRAALASTVDKTVQQKLQGASPAPAGPASPTPTRSKEVVYAELQRLAGSRKPEDRKKYEELTKEWDELNKST